MDAKELIVEKIKELGMDKKNLDASFELYQQFGFLLAQDISKAICPMNGLVAPITIAYLEGYANELRKKYPDCVPFAEEIKKGRTITIEREVD